LLAAALVDKKSALFVENVGGYQEIAIKSGKDAEDEMVSGSGN